MCIYFKYVVITYYVNKQRLVNYIFNLLKKKKIRVMRFYNIEIRKNNNLIIVIFLFSIFLLN